MNFWTKDGKIITDSSGHPILCDDCPCDCSPCGTLKARAEANGWEWHGEGVHVPLEYAVLFDGGGPPVCHYSDFRNRNRAERHKCCAISSDKIYYVDCSCTGIYEYSRTVTPDMYAVSCPDTMWGVLDWDYACECTDMRELLLTYPDVFGIVDVAFGSNAKYKYTYTDDWSGDTITSYAPVVTYSRVNYYDYNRMDAYLDYRTIVFVRRYFNASNPSKERREIFYLSPSNSPIGNSTQAVIYDTIELAGYITPFSSDLDISHDGHWSWAGRAYEWTYFEYQDSTSGACGLYSYDIPIFAQRISPPSIPSPMPPPPDPLIPSTAVIYREQYIQTSRGIMRYGENGYVPSFTLYGIRGSYGNPDWGNCYEHSGVPFDDSTVSATLIDDDMHWCDPEFEIPDLE